VLPSDAVGIALQGDGPILQVWKDPPGHPDVIVDDLGFGKAGRRIQNLVEV
jgi:hypothetical protein